MKTRLSLADAQIIQTVLNLTRHPLFEAPHRDELPAWHEAIANLSRLVQTVEIEGVASTRTQRGRFSQPEPKPTFNQHPQYEQWKNICPNCRSHSTTHYNGRSEEFNVMLRCTDCGYEFSLEQAFKAEQQRQMREGK